MILTEELNESVYIENKRTTHYNKRNKIVLCLALLAIVLLIITLYSMVHARASAEPAGVIINEVMSSNTFSYIDDNLGSPDWIELYNTSNFDISLKGYGISDDTSVPYKYTFDDVSIEAGEYLVLYAMPEADSEKICLGFSLSKEGESIALSDPNGSVVQILDVPELNEDIAWGRTQDKGYKYLENPTIGYANSDFVLDSLLESREEHDLSVLRINEIMPKTSSVLNGKQQECGWVEVCNTGSEDKDLSDFFLSDEKYNLNKWRFPQKNISPNECILVYLSGRDSKGQELHTSFRISESETSIYLTDGKTGATSETSWSSDIPTDISIGLDGNGDIKYYGLPTPGAQNNTKAFGSSEKTQMYDFIVNEILLENEYTIMDEDSERPAWVEFYNTSGQTLMLGQHYLSDDEENPYKWRFPEVAVKPGEYKLVYLSGKNKTGSELHTGFKIGSGENVLVITDKENMQQTLFKLNMDIREDVSFGIADTGEWTYFGSPTPGAENTTASFARSTDAFRFDLNGLSINEVLAAGSGRDWIEIANGEDSEIKLQGYYLSDSQDEPYKWQVPDVTVPAHGFAVIYASSDVLEQDEFTAPFGISASGEMLLLSSPSGTLIDSFETGVVCPGKSVGRLCGDETGCRVFFTSSTKGKANEGDSFSAYTSQPVFSESAGYLEEDTSVQISCRDEKAIIYYTTNGDTPDASSRVYTEQITISKSTPLRAVAISPGCLPSPVVTANYLVEDMHDIDVICITGDRDDINYTYSSSRRNREVGAYIEYFEQDGKMGTAFPAGIRVSGLISRSYPQKSLKIYLRGKYGQSSVVYPFFDGYPVVDYQSLTIRNSGQDLYYTHMKTAFFEMAVEGLNIDNTQQKPLAVYINGRYWGMYWLCENQNEDHFASVYDFDRNDIEVIRRNNTVVAGSSKEFLAVRKFARSHNMSNEENYNEFTAMVDEQAFMDYITVQTYLCNWDMYNQKYWRTVDYEHEWRPMLFDLDYAFRFSGRCYLSSYFSRYGVTWTGGDQSKTNMDIPYALLKNEGWKQEFIERYAYILKTNLASETIAPLFDSTVAEIENEMARHIKRWRAPRSYSSWEKEVKKLRKTLTTRTEQCMKSFQKYFDLSDERMAELFPDGGY